MAVCLVTSLRRKAELLRRISFWTLSSFRYFLTWQRTLLLFIRFSSAGLCDASKSWQAFVFSARSCFESHRIGLKDVISAASFRFPWYLWKAARLAVSSICSRWNKYWLRAGGLLMRIEWKASLVSVRLMNRQTARMALPSCESTAALRRSILSRLFL